MGAQGELGGPADAVHLSRRRFPQAARRCRRVRQGQRLHALPYAGLSMSEFQDWKQWLADNLDMSKDAMHIFVGLIIFLLVALLFRLSLRDWRPLAAVLFASIIGEIWDQLDLWRIGRALRFDLSVHDIVITTAWPFILFVLARKTRLLRR